MTSIGEYAFWLCPLEAIHGTENILHLGDGAFFGTHIAEPVLPEGLLSMGDAVFQNCDSITEITSWPLWRVPDGTFFECLGLMRVILPDTVEMLGAGAFYGCTALCDISLGEGFAQLAKAPLRAALRWRKLRCPKGLKHWEAAPSWIAVHCVSAACLLRWPISGRMPLRSARTFAWSFPRILMQNGMP